MASKHGDPIPHPIPQAKLRPPDVDALWRERLAQRLDRISQHRLGVVVGPAGSGKTTLLASFVARAAVPTAWFCPDAADGTAESMVQGLAAALAAAGCDLGRVENAESLAAGLDHWGVARALIVVDDLHEVAGTPAEAVVERVATLLPAGVHLLVATRREPAFNLPRLRVSVGLLEITPDDLRFRSWEVEELFRNFYNEPMAPEDLAALARRTGGWAAALQLFHLATRGKSPAERRRLLDGLAGRSRVVRDYLSRNLLDELPGELRAFLLRTSVLGRLTPQLCNDLLGGDDAGRLLTELERRQLFTTAAGNDGFRCHEVLRSHLESVLVEELGEAAVAALSRRAGELLLAAGYLPESLRAYWRAGDWAGVAHVLGTSGEELAASSGEWLDALSGALVEHDPWLLLATARRQLALGRPVPALAAYQRAADSFGPATVGETCRRERRDLSFWLEAPLSPRSDWIGHLRAAVGAGPLTAAREPTDAGPHALLVAGLAALCTGTVAIAADQLRSAAAHPAASPVLSLVARVLAAVADLLHGNADSPDLDTLADEAEDLGWPWIAGLAHGVQAFGGSPSRLDDAARAREVCRRNEDVWGEAVLALAEGLGRLRAGLPDAALLASAAALFHRLGATALEAWAVAGEALALVAAGADATSAISRAEAVARPCGARGPLALVAAAREALGQPVPEPAAALAAECSLAWIGDLGSLQPAGDGAAQPPTGLTIRCFGAFRLERAGRSVDLRSVKPRARAVLQLLAIHGGAPVHREVLADALWPDTDTPTALRNLHVAISSLRSALGGEAEANPIVRDGDSYRLALPPGSSIDTCTFDAAIAEARTAERSGMAAALSRALDAYGGDLLPEAGPAEWVVKPRESHRMQAAEAAQRLAGILVDAGDLAGAVRVCRRGLEIDRYRDGLWQALISALEQSGEPVAAARARRDYEQVLSELGLAASDPSSEEANR